MNTVDIRTVNVVQCIKLLCEDGSLPAIVKADDNFLYVIRKKALIGGIFDYILGRNSILSSKPEKS